MLTRAAFLAFSLAAALCVAAVQSNRAPAIAAQDHSVSLTIESDRCAATTVSYSYCSSNALSVAQGLAAAINGANSGYSAAASGDNASAQVSVTNPNCGNIKITSISTTAGSCNYREFSFRANIEITGVVSID